MMGEYIPLLLCVALIALWIKPLGGYMTAVYMGLPHPLLRALGGCEKFIYRLCGIHPEKEMNWHCYSFCVLAFGGVGFLLLIAIFMTQGMLPLNQEHVAGLSAHAAFNAAASFVTNSDWQSYVPETQLSYFSQTVAISVQMFLSAATGLAVAVALCRALAAKQSHIIGNFWVDMVRSVLYILLPLSLVFGLILVSQGVVQNYAAYMGFTSLEGAAGKIAAGPAALQTAIKMLGSNGGGFFAANSAHPFENPNAITDLLQITAILLLPITFVYTAALLMRDRRQAAMILATMLVLFIPLAAMIIVSEQSVSPKFDAAVIDTSEGNMEGKETRFGIASSAFWAAATTATSNGSVNSAHDSFAPLSGLAQMMLMQFGEVVFGGVFRRAAGLFFRIVFTHRCHLGSGIADLGSGSSTPFSGRRHLPCRAPSAAAWRRPRAGGPAACGRRARSCAGRAGRSAAPRTARPLACRCSHRGTTRSQSPSKVRARPHTEPRRRRLLSARHRLGPCRPPRLARRLSRTVRPPAALRPWPGPETETDRSRAAV